MRANHVQTLLAQPSDDATQAQQRRPRTDTWTGCINDRDQDYDTTERCTGISIAQARSKFYAEQWSACLPATVTPMSNQWQALKDQISAMTPSGNTNQAVGLAWGWQSLSTTNRTYPAPAKDATSIYKDYIVLLSDGLNTQNRWSTPVGNIDARQKMLCAEHQERQDQPRDRVHDPGQHQQRGSEIESAAGLRHRNGNFQMITTANQTSDAFKNILTQISKLRVAK